MAPDDNLNSANFDCEVAVCLASPIVSDFPGSATVSVASVGVPPAERCATDKFTRSVAVRAFR